MKTTIDFKRFLLEIFTGIYILSNIVPLSSYTYASSDVVVSPFKQVAKLECRFQDFGDLGSDCKQVLPTVNTKDYEKYAILNGGYNEYTRYYTVLWGASYKYGWDVGNGGHLGTDIATSQGTPVYSIADGKVINAKSDLSWGKHVTVEHTIRGKKVFSNYSHLSKLNVNVGDTVRAGTKVGEVGSTGNSTGNHLHFQIDLDTSFHPYYPDYKTCPYSYYDITENGACSDQIQANTIDPLLFLETNGSILDSVTQPTYTVSRSTINNAISNSNISEDLSIFDKTVYIGYSVSDIKRVQEIFKEMGVYKGAISGDYSDIESVMIDYQLNTGVISSRDEYGAGRFGPKTRTQALNDYKNYLTSAKTTSSSTATSSNSNSNLRPDTVVVGNKISRDKILTREEIEAMEIEEFLRLYNINIKINKVGGNISAGETVNLNMEIINKKTKKPFNGNTPLDITFGLNNELVSVFPTKIYNFEDGKRDIKLTGLKTGNTVLQVKLGSKTINTFDLKVYDSNTAVYPAKGLVVVNSKVVLGDVNKGIILFKDNKNKNLININYGSTYTLKGVGDTEVCIKSGNLKDINKIYNTPCDDSDYVKQQQFSYNDTIGGLVIFNYKTTGSDVKIEVVNNYNSEILGNKKITVTNPKGLTSNYAYYGDVINMLKEGITTGVNKGYFLEDRALTQADALVWIENTLLKLKSETLDSDMKSIIDNRLTQIKSENVSKYTTITREGFLDFTYRYLSFNNLNTTDYKKYRDLNDSVNKKIAIVFDNNTTWKDQFGDNYFRPGETLTRGEGAYFLNQVISKQRKLYLVNR
ncbi:MAG: M23 family metallopeptidase [Candidatus Gracilibacteria bacterium]|nr:M23 family metallopeptidase [Candidatus Gracilibacteria bacterium]